MPAHLAESNGKILKKIMNSPYKDSPTEETAALLKNKLFYKVSHYLPRKSNLNKNK